MLPAGQGNPVDLQATGLPDMSEWAEYRAPDEMCERAEAGEAEVLDQTLRFRAPVGYDRSMTIVDAKPMEYI